ncbi:Aldo/keto reductase [Hyaloscypha bicolor E]|uniref:Aldo/keto reductase n=1 Tax=Hyaloscypha bicolor E TaxID=1095630 RepID=A0A2J6SIN0_9HELO|nr:Aldo/keto reductase [Hyaloscypha bicolor E]PMD50590.1 Aldo/keto reductase [Hyaloscypha bicolor E]
MPEPGFRLVFFRGPAPKPLLGRHRVLRLSISGRVSPLLPGTMNFGTYFKFRNQYMGELSKETAFQTLDLYHSQGGNFIDTANNYQDDEIEEWLGDAMQQNRNGIVLATRFSGNHILPHAKEGTILSSYGRNISKALLFTVHNSLAKLRTNYLDILYFNTMPFVIYQGRWSVADREMEREILALCEAEQMAVAPWEVLGGGRFKTAKQVAQQKENDSRMEHHPGRAKTFDQVGTVMLSSAEEKGTANTFPLIDRRKVEHLKANIEALSVVLDEEDLRDIRRRVTGHLGSRMAFLPLAEMEGS